MDTPEHPEQTQEPATYPPVVAGRGPLMCPNCKSQMEQKPNDPVLRCPNCKQTVRLGATTFTREA